MAINVEGSFYCAREAAKDMMRRDAAGTIVLIGSMSGACVSKSLGSLFFFPGAVALFLLNG